MSIYAISHDADGGFFDCEVNAWVNYKLFMFGRVNRDVEVFWAMMNVSTILLVILFPREDTSPRYEILPKYPYYLDIAEEWFHGSPLE